MVKDKHLQEPFNRIPPEGPLPQFQAHNFPRTVPKKPVKRPISEEPSVQEPPVEFKPQTTPEPTITVRTKTADPEELTRLKMQLEIAQVNEKHLREELLVSSKQKKAELINQQAKTIEALRSENVELKERAKYKPSPLLKHEVEDSNAMLSLEEISENLKRLERLQQSLYKRSYS